MGHINVAVAGVGNIASCLIQGIEHYTQKKSDTNNAPVGLIHQSVGDYRPSDIRFVAAFDVDERKIGKDLSKAIFSSPNCVAKIADIRRNRVSVRRGPILDGVSRRLRGTFRVDPNKKPANVVNALKESKSDILVNLLPTASRRATHFYADSAIKAGCGFVNCIPEPICSDHQWARRFERAGLPVIGDDLKSQIGATVIHKSLLELFVKRGIKIRQTYQLNVGGNTDFLNLVGRSGSKEVSKTMALRSISDYDFECKVSPAAYIEFLKDLKVAHMFITGMGWAEQPVALDIKLIVPNSMGAAAVIADAIRVVKIALDRGSKGAMESTAAMLFKRPPVQYQEDEARRMFDKFVESDIER